MTMGKVGKADLRKCKDGHFGRSVGASSAGKCGRSADTERHVAVIMQRKKRTSAGRVVVVLEVVVAVGGVRPVTAALSV